MFMISKIYQKGRLQKLCLKPDTQSTRQDFPNKLKEAEIYQETCEKINETRSDTLPPQPEGPPNNAEARVMRLYENK